MGSFKDVVGHKNIIGYIRSAVREDKVSHAYIMNGARGSGKKTDRIRAANATHAGRWTQGTIRT